MSRAEGMEDDAIIIVDDDENVQQLLLTIGVRLSYGSTAGHLRTNWSEWDGCLRRMLKSNLPPIEEQRLWLTAALFFDRCKSDASLTSELTAANSPALFYREFDRTFKSTFQSLSAKLNCLLVLLRSYPNSLGLRNAEELQRRLADVVLYQARSEEAALAGHCFSQLPNIGPATKKADRWQRLTNIVLMTATALLSNLEDSTNFGGEGGAAEHRLQYSLDDCIDSSATVDRLAASFQLLFSLLKFGTVPEPIGLPVGALFSLCRRIFQLEKSEVDHLARAGVRLAALNLLQTCCELESLSAADAMLSLADRKLVFGVLGLLEGLFKEIGTFDSDLIAAAAAEKLEPSKLWQHAWNALAALRRKSHMLPYWFEGGSERCFDLMFALLKRLRSASDSQLAMAEHDRNTDAESVGPTKSAKKMLGRKRKHASGGRITKESATVGGQNLNCVLREIETAVDGAVGFMEELIRAVGPLMKEHVYAGWQRTVLQLCHSCAATNRTAPAALRTAAFRLLKMFLLTKHPDVEQPLQVALSIISASQLLAVDGHQLNLLSELTSLCRLISRPQLPPTISRKNLDAYDDAENGRTPSLFDEEQEMFVANEPAAPAPVVHKEDVEDPVRLDENTGQFVVNSDQSESGGEEDVAVAATVGEGTDQEKLVSIEPEQAEPKNDEISSPVEVATNSDAPIGVAEQDDDADSVILVDETPNDIVASKSRNELDESVEKMLRDFVEN